MSYIFPLFAKIGCVGSEWMKNWSLEPRFLLDVAAYFIFNAVKNDGFIYFDTAYNLLDSIKQSRLSLIIMIDWPS